MRKRNLSEFMCIEMLYDYQSEKLDALRSMAVEEGLESSPKVRAELKKLSLGISYCNKLKNISVSQELIELIHNQPKTTEKILSKVQWHRFPQPVRWALEAVVVAVAIALFVTQVPDLFKSDRVEIDSLLVKKFDIKPPEETPVAVTEEIKVAYKAPETVPMDLQPVDGTKPVEKAIEKPVAIVATKEIPSLLQPPPKVVPPVEAKPEKVPVETVVAAIATAPAAETTVPAETQKAVPKKGNAYVYRMTMFVEDVDHVTSEIVALISSLSGEKAGEVELGWRRKGGSYFHFSVPQSNSVAMQEGLKKYAQFQIVKSSHPRVMPEGTERYILWVEKKSTGEESNAEPNEGSAESPEAVAPAENDTQGPSEETNEAN